MSFEQVAKQLTPEVYAALKQSLQLGKWPDGRILTAEQKEICMDALITYEASNNIPEEQRVGYIARNKPTPCSTEESSAATQSWTPPIKH